MTDVMDIDNGGSPMNINFMDTLQEPWKSIARGAIPPSSTEGDSQQLLPSSTRLEQLEVDARSHLFDLLKDHKSNNAQTIGEFWTVVLNFCYHLVYFANKKSADSRYVEMEPRKLPLLLIEDCLDGLTLQECKTFWTSHVEPALDNILLGDLFWESSKACHLQFLRVCNQFLNRMEATDSEWKGRIMMSLAKAFSIADPSAKKLWGNFHTSNNTDFETQEEFEATARPSTSTSSSIDYNLYRAFWSLQSDFSNPNSIQLADFINKMKLVLDALESASSSTARGKDTTIPAASSTRYLTSSTLLLTQLDTAEFRTSVISQFLIVANHLSAESPSLANALSVLLSRARKLLQKDNKELYSILFGSILTNREVQWRQWKKTNKSSPAAFAPKRKNGDTTGNSKNKRKRSLLDGPLGGDANDNNSDQYQVLGRDDLIEISQKLVQTTPSLEKHLEDYVDALDPESGIEEEYHPKNDSLFTWRAMRLYAKHQLPRLRHCRQPADLERMTREWYKEQGKEIPGEMPPVEEDSDDESVKSKSIKSSNSSSQEDDVEMKEVDEAEKEKDEEDSKEEVVKIASDDDDGDDVEKEASQEDEQVVEEEEEEEEEEKVVTDKVKEDDETINKEDETDKQEEIEIEDEHTESVVKVEDADEQDTKPASSSDGNKDKEKEETTTPPPPVPSDNDKTKNEKMKKQDSSSRGDNNSRGRAHRRQDNDKRPMDSESRGRSDDRRGRYEGGNNSRGRYDVGGPGPRRRDDDRYYDDRSRGRYDDGGPPRRGGRGGGNGPRDRRDDRRDYDRRGGRR